MAEKGRANFSSIFSIVFSMAISAIGSGIVFAYVPFTLAEGGYPAWIAGSAVTAVAGGGLIGCLIAGPLIRRVGHARAFACFAALVILSGIMIGLGVLPAAWVASRALYGLASNANFIVVQSWLNHAASNEWRGRAMSVFYMSYVVGLGTGSLIFGYLPTDTATGPLVAIACYTLAILPIGLTSLPNPPPPGNVAIILRKAWRISPVALAGVFASGGLSMLVQGFTPIYAAGEGLAREQVAALMFLMQLGMLGVQFPLGALSDFIDRRLVLVISCLLIAGAAGAAMLSTFEVFVVAVLIYALWSGATETIYSIANAHANDKADPQDYVPLSSTLLVAWSASAFIFPAAVTLATPWLGPKSFMFAAMGVALAFAAFALARITIRKDTKETGSEATGYRSAQIPNAEILVAANDLPGQENTEASPR